MRCAPTAGAALVLCAATAGLLSAQGRPAQPEPPRFASWDEMNLLAHGLLQLGHGLREHVERTRGQLGALERRMAACGNACQGPKGTDPKDRVPEGQAPETLQSLQVGASTRALTLFRLLLCPPRNRTKGLKEPTVRGWKGG